MLVERNIEFELKGLGPLVKRVLLNPFFFYDKRKISMANTRVIIYS